MNISIIICTHNRADLLRDALLSIERMSVPKGCNVGLIVVDNASTDNTSDIINTFIRNKKFYVKGLFEPRLGKTYALNRAIKSAAGEVLIFVDDDHIVSNGYLDAINKALKENPSYNIFCGRILPNWDGTEPQWVHDNTVYPIRPFPIPCFDLGDKTVEAEPGRGMFIPGAGNLMLKRSVFKKIGLFSEQLGPRGHNLSGGEDIEFIRRALKKGERLIYIPDALQYHQVKKDKLTLTYLVKKAYYRSMAANQFSEKDSLHHFNNIPIYLLRQAFTRFIKSLFAIKHDARRYYLVRFAATLGEIQGRRKSSGLWNSQDT